MKSRPAPALVVSRRELFTLIGAATVLVACGTKSSPKPPITSRTPTPSGDTTGGALGSDGVAGSVSAKSAAPPATAGGAGSVAHVGGPHATGADAMTVADAQREAQVANGHWQGGWHDASGASGDSDVVIAIDGASRTATATVSFGGKLFGTAVPAVTYDIDLLSFMMTADSYNVSSPQFGQLTIVPGGSTNASGSARAIPGQPTIDHVDVNGTMAGNRVDVSYTVHYADGHTVKGTMAWTSTGARATPAALGSAGTPTMADIASGAYAADLLDGKTLSTIFGVPFEAPHSNGGNLRYDVGIATSNGQAMSTSGDYSVEYTVYVGTSAADTAAFWKKQGSGLPTSPGPWLSSLSYPGSLGFYAELPTRVLMVRVVPLKETGAPTAQQIAMVQQWTVQVATALANNLKSG